MNRPTRRQRRVTVVLLLVCISLLALDYGGNGLGGARHAATSAFGPVERGFNTVVMPVGRFFAGLPKIGSTTATIDSLRRKNAELRSRLSTSSLDGARSAELRRLGLLVGASHFTAVTGTVLGLGPSLGYEWTAQIDAGSRNGVKAGMTVINANGLVGRIKMVGPTTSTVILAVDPGSSVGVRVARTGELGIVTGAGLKSMSYVPLNPGSTFRVGDELVTGPYGASTYAAGVPFGKVTRVIRGGTTSTPTAKISPDVDFTSLDVVAVVLVAPRPVARVPVPPTKPKKHQP